MVDVVDEAAFKQGNQETSRHQAVTAHLRGESKNTFLKTVVDICVLLVNVYLFSNRQFMTCSYIFHVLGILKFYQNVNIDEQRIKREFEGEGGGGQSNC